MYLVKIYCFSIILTLFTSLFVFAQSTMESTRDYFITGIRPLIVPTFNPESDRFFGTELQNAFARRKSRLFSFVSAYLDIFRMPEDLITYEYHDKEKNAIRFSGALGGMFPINQYLSLMGGVSFAEDDLYLVNSTNIFVGAGVLTYQKRLAQQR